MLSGIAQRRRLQSYIEKKIPYPNAMQKNRIPSVALAVSTRIDVLMSAYVHNFSLNSFFNKNIERTKILSKIIRRKSRRILVAFFAFENINQFIIFLCEFKIYITWVYTNFSRIMKLEAPQEISD